MNDKSQALARALEEYLVRRCIDEDVNYRSVPRFINHVLKNVQNFNLEPMLQLLSSDFLEATFNQYRQALVK